MVEEVTSSGAELFQEPTLPWSTVLEPLVIVLKWPLMATEVAYNQLVSTVLLPPTTAPELLRSVQFGVLTTPPPVMLMPMPEVFSVITHGCPPPPPPETRISA